MSLDPDLQLNSSFQNSGEAALKERWWEALDSNELNEHIEEALDSSLSLEAAWQRLLAAEAQLKNQRAERLPRVDAEADLRFRETDSTDGRISVGLGLSAAYEVDFWGRIGALIEAQRFNTQVASEDLQTIALTLSSEVALAWLSLAESLQRQSLLENQLDINSNIEQVLLARFSSGQVDSADVLRQRQLIESTRQQLYAAEERISIASNRLRVLKGLAPGVVEPVSENELPVLPPLPDPGIPSGLVQRRPDVRAAQFELFANNAELAAAIANQYPSFNLSASLSSTSSSVGELFDTWTAQIIGQLTAPLFDGGARRAEVERREALVHERVAIYGQTILEACQEVEDALVSEATQMRVYDSLKKELQLNEQTFGQLRTRYLNGATDYLSLLTNLRDGQQLQRDILSSQLDLLNNRIALYRALAGGIQLERAQAEG